MIIERIHDDSGRLIAIAGMCTHEDSARYFRSLDAATQNAVRQSHDPAVLQVYGPLTQADGYAESYPNGCPIIPESND